MGVSERKASVARARRRVLWRTVVHGDRHRQLARRVVELVLQDALNGMGARTSAECARGVICKCAESSPPSRRTQPSPPPAPSRRRRRRARRQAAPVTHSGQECEIAGRVAACQNLKASSLTLSGFFASIILQHKGGGEHGRSRWAQRVGGGRKRTAPSGPRSTTRTAPATPSPGSAKDRGP